MRVVRVGDANFRLGDRQSLVSFLRRRFIAAGEIWVVRRVRIVGEVEIVQPVAQNPSLALPVKGSGPDDE